MISTANVVKRIVLAVAGFAAVATLLAVQFATSQQHKLLQNGNTSTTNTITTRRMLKTADDMPSLQLHVSVKRPSIKMFGMSEFDVVATPVLTTAADGSQSVYYNGIATFQEDGTTHTYKLVDGVAYYVTKSDLTGYASESVTCLTSSSLPPVKDMLDALNSATHVAGVQSSQAISCPTGKLMQTTLSGETFVLCTMRTSTPGFAAYSADFDVKVSYLASPVTITKPAMSESQAASCVKTPTSTNVSKTTLNLLKGNAAASYTTAVVSTQATAVLPAATCGCKGAKRACVFVHGLGQATDSGLVDSFDYFGDDVADHAPCCSSIKYAVLNTVDNAWHSDTLQQRLCDLSLKVGSTSSSSTKTISDTIIVTHSMSNLMLGGAIATGKCKLASTTSWVSISGPMKGSMSADFLQDACAGNTNGFISAIAGIIGRCPANTATKSMSYQGDKYSTAEINAKYTAAQDVFAKSVAGVMCSNDHSGLLSTDQIALNLASSLIPHKSDENDGIVEYQSCRAGIATSKFSNTYTSPFYVTKLNHLDTTMRHGDALFQNSQKPVKWFECLL